MLRGRGHPEKMRSRFGRMSDATMPSTSWSVPSAHGADCPRSAWCVRSAGAPVSNWSRRLRWLDLTL